MGQGQNYDSLITVDSPLTASLAWDIVVRRKRAQNLLYILHIWLLPIDHRDGLMENGSDVKYCKVFMCKWVHAWRFTHCSFVPRNVECWISSRAYITTLSFFLFSVDPLEPDLIIPNLWSANFKLVSSSWEYQLYFLRLLIFSHLARVSFLGVLSVRGCCLLSEDQHYYGRLHPSKRTKSDGQFSDWWFPRR